jgi:hypothetical protein
MLSTPHQQEEPPKTVCLPQHAAVYPSGGPFGCCKRAQHRRVHTRSAGHVNTVLAICVAAFVKRRQPIATNTMESSVPPLTRMSHVLRRCVRSGCERLRQAVGRRCGEHYRRAEIRGHPEGLTVGADGDGPVFIGAKDLSVQGPIALEDRPVGMPEPTLPRHREHHRAGADSAQERLAAGGPTAVMGWFA